eukprot:NODE_323_length_950_cov_385.222357_g316_i0.p1 GENE.NODE_323_length_950_cov_385.222357_g316_i0~~NODE_323_length_950_cov_385.222357_g316_i0.p1  ORF type:complete len:286 (-),score=32.29 NODE_323_length_950_cov_385.222357_g316_i0:10-867(-)
MSFDAVDIVNAATLEKVVLSQRIAAFLNDPDKPEEQRTTVENVARMLAQDIAQQVREALAFELRNCRYIPHDLAAKIAADVESVSSPFLATTEAFTDVQFAGLIPHLEEHAHITIARRPDVGPQTSMAIVSVGSEKSVSFLVRNDHIDLPEEVCGKVVKRFGEQQPMMDMLSKRVDLPLVIVEDIVERVSNECRTVLVEHYELSEPLAEELMLASKFEAIWHQLEKASPSQVHAYVIDLRKSGRLTTDMILEFASRGKLTFMESAIALDCGLTLGAVREALYGGE